MIGSKYIALKKHFLNERVCSGEQLKCWMEDAKVHMVSRRKGNGLQVCDFSYDAIFRFENIKVKPEKVIVLLTFWLMANDENRSDFDLPEPDFEPESHGRGKVDLEVTVKFREPLGLVEDDSGEFSYKGVRYRIDHPEVDVADTASVATEEGKGDRPHTRPIGE